MLLLQNISKHRYLNQFITAMKKYRISQAFKNIKIGDLLNQKVDQKLDENIDDKVDETIQEQTKLCMKNIVGIRVHQALVNSIISHKFFKTKAMIQQTEVNRFYS